MIKFDTNAPWELSLVHIFMKSSNSICFEHLVSFVLLLAWPVFYIVLSCPNTLNLLAVLVAREDEANWLTQA